jgi:hypothetical protein
MHAKLEREMERQKAQLARELGELSHLEELEARRRYTIGIACFSWRPPLKCCHTCA